MFTVAGGAAGGHHDDQNPNKALFQRPTSVCCDSMGNEYVADSESHCIRKRVPGGGVVTLAGQPGARGCSDGRGSDAKFDSPMAVCCNASGTLFVADCGNHRICIVASDGTVSTLAGGARKGSQDGPAACATFCAPWGVAFDGCNGRLVVADTGNHKVRAITLERALPGDTFTRAVVYTIAGGRKKGSADGPGDIARFSAPAGVAVCSTTSHIYVTEWGSHRVRRISSPSCLVTTVCGVRGVAGFQDGPGAQAQFTMPLGIACDGDGDLIIADLGNHRVRHVALSTSADGMLSADASSCTVRTLAGDGSAGWQDALGPQAQFNNPRGVTCDAAGNVLVADGVNNRIRCIVAGFQPPAWHAAPQRTRTRTCLDGSLVGNATGQEVDHPDRTKKSATAVAAVVTGAKVGSAGMRFTLGADLGKLLRPAPGPPFPDLEFVVGGETVPAHRVIVCARSEYFSAVLGTPTPTATATAGSLHDGVSSAGDVATVYVEDATVGAFRAVLRYLYTDEAALDESIFVEVACLCQRYLVQGMHEILLSYATNHVSPTNAVNWLITADEQKLGKVRDVLCTYVIHNYRRIKESAPGTLQMLESHPQLMLEVLSNGFDALSCFAPSSAGNP